MLRSFDAGLAPVLPRMGPGFILRVLSKRARAVPAGPVAPLTSRFTLPRLDFAHVARYRAALGFTADAVPLTWWYLPVQRAHMATLLSDAFPYRLAGIVHVENALIAHAPVPGDTAIMLATCIDVLPTTASGAVYCALETVGSAGGERIFTCTSSYLAVRGARSGKPKGEQPAVGAGTVIDSWTLGPSSGRDYARVSGDWNPIHLARWSARLMGLPAPIIHGMHSVARTCAALEAHGGRRVAALSARFRSPVTLGTTARLSCDEPAGRYTLHVGTAPAVEGVFRFG